MIKKAIYTFVLVFILPSLMMAQPGNSIQYASSNPNTDPSPGNNGANVTLDYQATSGGRHSYRYIFSLTPLTYMEVKYRNAQWEIYGFETGGTPEEILFYTSAVQSTPNPPNLTFGNWSNEMTNFSGTGTQSALVLPVELLHFNAATGTGKNHLTWATASERNNAGFEIEKSTDGTQFEKIGFVAGAGNSSEKTEYAFEDASAFERSAQVVYYRLRQVDHDGAFEYSKIVSVKNTTGNTSIKIYPTTTTGLLTVEAEGASVDVVTVVNQVGKVVLTAQKVSRVDMSALPAGLYLVQVQAGQEQLTERVFKQ